MRPEEAVVISLLSIPELAFESNKPVTNQLGPAASRPAQEAGRGVPLDQPDRGRSDELCGRPDQASYVGRLYRLGAAPVDSHRQQAPSLGGWVRKGCTKEATVGARFMSCQCSTRERM